MISLQALFDQIAEQGAEWGLVPVWRDGGRRVGVAEVVAEHDPARRSDRVTVMDEGYAVIASYDENAPLDAFSILLSKRIQRHQHDFMKLVMKRQERLARERSRVMEDMREDIRKRFLAKFERSRTLFGPGIMQRERVW